MKAYPAYKESGMRFVEKIPVHWEFISLKCLLLDGNDGIKIGPFGSSLKLESIKTDGYKVYGQGNVINDDFEWGHRHIDDEKFSEMGVYELFPGDIIITMMGTTGKSKVVPPDIKRGIIDSHLIRIRVNEKTFSNFISLLINDSYYVFNQVKINSKGSIMEGLNSSIIKTLQITLPPLSEQQSIVGFLDHKTAQIDTLVAKKQRQIELLQEQRTALINQVVTKGLNPDVPMKDSGLKWLGEIPSHWEKSKLKFLGQIRYGLGQPPKELENGVPIIRATNVERGKIVTKDMLYVDPSDVPLGRIPFLKENEIIVVRSGAYTADSAIIPAEYAGAIAGYDLVLTPISINPKLLSYSLLSYYVLNNQLYLERMRAAQPHLNAEELGETIIVYPPLLQEQTDIARYLDKMTKKLSESITKITKEIELLQEYRKAIISEAVTGKIDVRTKG